MVETGIEQYLRDARITRIYEGTNESQAIDLLMRKVLADRGERLGLLLDEMAEAAQTARAGADSDARQAGAAGEQSQVNAPIDAAATGGAADRASRMHECAGWARDVRRLASELRDIVVWMESARQADARAPYRIASDFLHLVGHAAFALVWLRMATVALREPAEPLHAAKLDAARVYFAYLLPEAGARLAIVRSAAVPCAVGPIEPLLDRSI